VNAALVAVVAGAVTLVATPLVMAVAGRLGVVDRPGALKPQATAVPYLGGVAVFAGLLVGVLAGRPSVVVPLAMALALGVADDRAELAPVLRLAGQLAIGVAVAVTVPVHLEGAAGGVLVVVITVLVVNGVNLIDGLDLLATGVVLASAVGFAVVVHGSARDLAVALAAALAAFAKPSLGAALAPAGDAAKDLAADNIREIARALFRQYALAFEAVGVLLLTAVVAVMVMAKRKLES